MITYIPNPSNSMTMRTSTRLLAPIALAALAGSASLSSAADLDWDGGGGGGSGQFWGVAANYDPDGLPTSGDNVFVPNTSAFTVAVGGATDINLGTSQFSVGVPGGTQTVNMRIRQGQRTLTGDLRLTGTLGGPTIFSRTGADAGLAEPDGSFIFNVTGQVGVRGASVTFGNTSSVAGTNGLVLNSGSMLLEAGAGISITGTQPITFDTSSIIGNANVLSLNGGLFSLAGTSDYTTIGLSIIGAASSQYNVAGAVQIGSLDVQGFGAVAPGTYTAGALNTLTSSTRFVDGMGTLTVVPEPTTVALFIGGGLAVVALRRRSRRA